MDEFSETLRSAMERWPVRQRYLIGVSGGVDSAVLLHSLHREGYRKLSVCHLDHGLRGKVSAADARWVERLGAKLGYPVFVERRKVREEAGKAGISIETAGRRARHRFFAAVAGKTRCRRIFLAHHAGDQAETVLMHLCRGSAGPSGMKLETELSVPGFRRPLEVLRPLLGVPKPILEEEARRHGWKFRQDAGNAVADVVRNRVRLEALPLLNEIFRRDPGPALARAAAWTEAARDYLEACAASWTGQESLNVTEVRSLAPVLRDTVLAGWLRARGVPDISHALIGRVAGMLDPSVGPARWNAPGNCFLRRRAGRLRVERLPACGMPPDGYAGGL